VDGVAILVECRGHGSIPQSRTAIARYRRLVLKAMAGSPEGFALTTNPLAEGIAR
jgi:hypothetical protein